MKHHISSDMISCGSPSQSIPLVGYRFHPTDDELLTHFLQPKMLHSMDYQPPIPEVKVCDYEPWDLPALISTNSNDQVWYFFCPRDYKYLRSRRSNRTTEAGYWKPTGKHRKVLNKHKQQIGNKKSLVFYIKEQPKPIRTRWIIHEYENAPNSSMATTGDFVLCKLKSKADEKIRKRKTPADMVLGSDIENQNLNEITVNSSCYEHESNDKLKTKANKETGEGKPIDLVLESDIENQNWNEMTAISSCYEHESNDKLKTKANKETCEGKPTDMVLESDIENQNLDEMTVNAYCDEHESNDKLKTKADEEISEGKPIDMVLESDIENQNLNEKAVNSSCDEHEWSIHLSSESDDYNPDEMTNMPNYEEDEWTCLLGFDCENQNIKDVTTNTSGDEDTSHNYLGSDIGNETPNEKAAMSISANDTVSQETDISAYEGSEWSPYGPTLSDASNSTTTNNNVSEVDPLISYINEWELEELAKLIEEDKYNSAFYQLPIIPNESSSYSSFGLWC
ncbi:NAC domain containing protein 6 [Euphorbia peplus]|nr:NAC domain containing protein 6 [Euphorbia peplus]